MIDLSNLSKRELMILDEGPSHPEFKDVWDSLFEDDYGDE